MTQPLPKKNLEPFVVDELVKELEERKQKGIQTYGTALQAFNGRNAIQDLKEELLDALVYLKQIELENNQMKELIKKFYWMDPDDQMFQEAERIVNNEN